MDLPIHIDTINMDLKGSHVEDFIFKLLAFWVIVNAFVFCWLISKLTFFKYFFRNTIWESNGLDPDQDEHFGPNLDPNCLQRLSADDKSRRQRVYWLIVWLSQCNIENLTHWVP